MWKLSLDPLTPAGSKIVRVIAADKILADFGHRFWSALRAAPEPKSKIFARILSLLKGAESSFLYNQLGVDLVPVEHILIDNIPEIAQVM